MTTANNSFGPTEISYLGSSFYALAVKANRYIVMNNNDPRTGNITEEKEYELLDFIDYAKIVTGVLGHKIFEELVERESTTKLIEENNKLYLKILMISMMRLV